MDALISECDWNLDLLNSVIDMIQRNQENPTTRSIEKKRFGVSAIKLLTTNRYVDEDRPFFKLAQNYLTQLFAMNGQLRSWLHSPEETENWFLKEKDRTIDLVSNFRSEVKISRKKLVGQY